MILRSTSTIITWNAHKSIFWATELQLPQQPKIQMVHQECQNHFWEEVWDLRVLVQSWHQTRPLMGSLICKSNKTLDQVQQNTQKEKKLEVDMLPSEIQRDSLIAAKILIHQDQIFTIHIRKWAIEAITQHKRTHPTVDSPLRRNTSFLDQSHQVHQAILLKWLLHKSVIKPVWKYHLLPLKDSHAKEYKLHQILALMGEYILKETLKFHQLSTRTRNSRDQNLLKLHHVHHKPELNKLGH